jgi:hypothetical protein
MVHSALLCRTLLPRVVDHAPINNGLASRLSQLAIVHHRPPALSEDVARSAHDSQHSILCSSKPPTRLYNQLVVGLVLGKSHHGAYLSIPLSCQQQFKPLTCSAGLVSPPRWASSIKSRTAEVVQQRGCLFQPQHPPTSPYLLKPESPPPQSASMVPGHPPLTPLSNVLMRTVAQSRTLQH